MDGNSDPDGEEKKGGGDFGMVFLFLRKKKNQKTKQNCKAPGKKRRGVLSEYHQTPINKKESQQTEPAAHRVTTQGEIRSSPAFFL